MSTVNQQTRAKVITAEEAQQKAARFLQENNLIRFETGVAQRLVSPLRSAWIVPVQLSYPGYGLVGSVGVIAVDEETSNVVAWTPREEMLTTAGELYQDQREAVEASQQVKPPEDPHHPHIYQRQGAAGYEPCIRGTRVSVRAIVEWQRIYNDLDRVLEAVPHITREQAEDALYYYADHKEEIDFFIAENDEEYRQYLHQAWERRWKGAPQPSTSMKISS